MPALGPVVVIKVGTSTLIRSDGDGDQHGSAREPRLSALAALVECVCQLRRRGYRPVLVSSGAIGMGLRVLRDSVDRKPKQLAKKQARALILIERSKAF